MGVWIAVAVGGAIGSVARHAVNHLVHARWLTTRFPAGTVVVNVTGCFLIGLLTGLIASNRLTLRFFWREFVFVGILGGFTTFSTFGLDGYEGEGVLFWEARGEATLNWMGSESTCTRN